MDLRGNALILPDGARGSRPGNDVARMQAMLRRNENNFLYLLIGLLVVLLLAPIGVGRFEGIVNLAFTLTMVTGVWSLAKSRSAYIVGWILGSLSLLISVFDLASAGPWLLPLGAGVALLFCGTSMVIVLGEVLFGPHLTVNRMAGAVCVYLLLGLSWAFVYGFIFLAAPGSFEGIPPESPEGQFLTLVYYSFVTLTTMGYGDITPVSHLARALAYLEAVTGVMYVAVLVASLIGSADPRTGKSGS